MNNIFGIIEAWKKSFSPSEEQIQIAKNRAEICNGCEYKVELNNALLSKFTENDKILNKFKCNRCGCPLSKKIFARLKTACPLNKWTI